MPIFVFLTKILINYENAILFIKIGPVAQKPMFTRLSRTFSKRERTVRSYRNLEEGRKNGGQNPNQVRSFIDESVSIEADDESCAEQSQIFVSTDSSSGTRNPSVFFPVVVESTELTHFAP